MDIDAVFKPIGKELIDDVFPTPIKYLQTEQPYLRSCHGSDDSERY